MKLTVNGEAKEYGKAETVRQLLDALHIVPGRVAVEVNRSVIKKGEYEQFKLKDGDTVEIVNFVGGGDLRFGMHDGNYRMKYRKME